MFLDGVLLDDGRGTLYGGSLLQQTVNIKREPINKTKSYDIQSGKNPDPARSLVKIV